MIVPRVAVLMPVFNAEKYLRASIESILTQTFGDFLFYIINDGSTDSSEEIILSYKDPRIRYLKNEVNIGLIDTLNRGIESIQNEFIARMDADDISRVDRLEKQLNFMDSNSEVVVCGGQIAYFGSIQTETNFPLSDREIRANLLFETKINHPTAFFRTAVVHKQGLRYNKNFPVIEDYEFWIRFSKHGKLENLPDLLLDYRWEGQNVTAQKRATRHQRFIQVYTLILQELEIPISNENLDLHWQLSNNSSELGKIKNVKSYMHLIIAQNKKLGIYDQVGLNKILKQYWDQLFFKVADISFRSVVKYWLASKNISLFQIRYFIGRRNIKKRAERNQFN